MIKMIFQIKNYLKNSDTTYFRARQGPQTLAKCDISKIVWPPNMNRSIILANYYLVVFDDEHNLKTGPTGLTDISRFYISTIVWPQNMIRNILIAIIYIFNWKLFCIMSLYQIWARQGPHIKIYLISWQLLGQKYH